VSLQPRVSAASLCLYSLVVSLQPRCVSVASLCLYSLVVSLHPRCVSAASCLCSLVVSLPPRCVSVASLCLCSLVVSLQPRCVSAAPPSRRHASRTRMQTAARRKRINHARLSRLFSFSWDDGSDSSACLFVWRSSYLHLEDDCKMPTVGGTVSDGMLASLGEARQQQTHRCNSRKYIF